MFSTDGCEVQFPRRTARPGHTVSSICGSPIDLACVLAAGRWQMVPMQWGRWRFWRFSLSRHLARCLCAGALMIRSVSGPTRRLWLIVAIPLS